MLYNRCAGIYKFGNNTYPRRIRRRSNLFHIFRGKKSASYGPGNTIILITYTEDVSLTSVIQHAKRMRLVILPSVAWLLQHDFPQYLINGPIF